MNRSIWIVVVVAAAGMIAISMSARRHGVLKVGHVREVMPEDVAPQEPSHFSEGGRTTFPMPTPARRFNDQLPPPAVDTAPATRPAVPRPPRQQNFTDATADQQLTPQKVARTALSYVGVDPVAEQVWEAAINSPNFSPDERKDLIEDLNEEGFDDPKNLTTDDIPLIVNRLELIQALAPQAADETNAAAFAEAYKDLVNMLAKVTKG